MDPKRLEELVNEYLKTKGEITCAVIYGSYALGESTERSDIDLLLVTKDDEKMETCHELIDGKLIEITMIGTKLFDRMVEEANPFIVGALRHGIPIYGKEATETAKKSFSNKTLKGWSKKYYIEGMKRLKEAETDSNETIAALTFLLNAYLLASNDPRLSYSLEKLTKRIKDENLRSLLNDFIKTSDIQGVEYVKRIAEVLRPKILE